MWKDEIKKQRSEEQQTDAMDFAVSVTDKILTLLNRSRPQRDLTLGQRGEVRRYLKKLFLEAKLDEESKTRSPIESRDTMFSDD